MNIKSRNIVNDFEKFKNKDYQSYKPKIIPTPSYNLMINKKEIKTIS